MLRKPSGKYGIVGVDVQTDDMHRVFAPGDGYFHAVDEFDAVFGGGFGGFFQTGHVVVIGQRQHLHFASGSTCYQFSRCKGAVGKIGMAMQVVIQHQRSPPPFFMTLPSSARLRRTSFGSAISGR